MSATERIRAGRPIEVVRFTVGLVIACGVLVVAVVTLLGLYASDLGEARAEYLVAVGLVTAVALPLAASTAWVAGRDFTNDLRHVEAGLGKLLVDPDAPISRARLSVRTLDELGGLVRAFDELNDAFDRALEREHRLLREAEAAEAVKAEFLRAVSHELRTPLNSILGFADVLLTEIDGPLTAEQHQDLCIIRDAGEHLITLFNDVLDLSAAATNQLRLTRTSLDPGEIVTQVAAELRGLRGTKPVELVVHVGPDVPKVLADATRLRQVVTNLASNALKFTDEGEVRLEVERSPSGVTIRCVDTGVGIQPEALGRIFLEFDQLAETTPASRRRGGAGLGLAISRRLVELHGGTLRASSVPGRGSVFEVLLPSGSEESA
ncbi:MAG: HAMP domain-containing histidine kinase [Myxococcales bacterium]|nr:HAMP domain-containing histidine kinase [Myxococcales bacterium]